MGIQYVGGQTSGRAGATSTSNQTFALTGGIDTVPRSGDFVVVTIVVGSQARNPSLALTAQGYTDLTQLNPNTQTYDTSLSVSYKHMGATPDTAVTMPSTGNNQDAQSWEIKVYRGVDNNNPMDVAAVSASGTGTTRADPAAITPVTAGSWIVVCSGGAAAAASALTYSALTNVLTTAQADTNDAVVGGGYYTGWTSGAYDPAASSTGDATSTSSWASYTLALRPRALVETITDDFEATLDSGKWATVTNGTGSTAATTSGSLELTVADAVAGNYALAYTVGNQNLQGSSAFAKLVRPARTTGDVWGADSIFRIEADPTLGTGDRVYWLIGSDGYCGVWKQDNFSGTELLSLTTDYFNNASTYTWFRIRESGGTVYFDTAPLSASNPPASGDWVNRHSVALSSLPANLSYVNAQFTHYFGNASAGVPIQQPRWDGFNTSASVLEVTGSMAATEAQDTTSIDGDVLIAGSLDATEAQDTTSIEGDVLIAGSFAATDPQDVFAATGEYIIFGTLAAVESTDVFASEGTVLVSGTLAAAETADTFAAEGTVAVVGTLAATEATDSFASAGAVAIVGTLDAIEAADTFVSTGEVKIAGVLDATEAPDAFESSGTVEDGELTGTMAAVEAQDVFESTGAVAIVGSFAATEAEDIFAWDGVVKIEGSFAVTDLEDTFSSVGIVIVTGTLASTDEADIFVTDGVVAIAGSFAAIEAMDEFFAPGGVVVTGAMDAVEAQDDFSATSSLNVTGYLAAMDPQDYLEAHGVVKVTGIADLIEVADVVLITGYVPNTGFFEILEEQDVFASTGKTINYGTLAVTEEPDIFIADGNAFYQYPLRGKKQTYPISGAQTYPLSRTDLGV